MPFFCSLFISTKSGPGDRHVYRYVYVPPHWLINSVGCLFHHFGVVVWQHRTGGSPAMTDVLNLGYCRTQERVEVWAELLLIHISGQHLIFFKIFACGYNFTVLSDYKAGHKYHDRSSNSVMKQTSFLLIS